MERDVLIREIADKFEGEGYGWSQALDEANHLVETVERFGYTIVRAEKPPSRAMNPPIRGHELLWEGRNWTEGGVVLGGCRCGARPEGCGHLSMGTVKRWHREHKAVLRGGGF